MEADYYRQVAETQEKHWWYEGRRRILAALVEKLRLPAGAAILEVGCGPGANLNMLKKFGTVTGVEPDDYSIAHAREVSGCRVEKGFLPDDLRVSGPFDLVGAFDVIEHVEPDRESLKTLCGLTRKGGYALFTVPAWPFLWSEFDVINHHKRRYVLPQFRGILREAGYEVEFISYYNTILSPLIVAVRLLKNLLKIKDGGDEAAVPSPFVNKILGAIFAFERHILKYMPLPFGVSIIAVCRKS